MSTGGCVRVALRQFQARAEYLLARGRELSDNALLFTPKHVGRDTKKRCFSYGVWKHFPVFEKPVSF